MLFSSGTSRNFVILWRRSQFQLQLHTTLSEGSQRGTGSLALSKGIGMVVGGLPTPKDASQKRSSHKYYQICQICNVCPIIFCQFLYHVLLYPEESQLGLGKGKILSTNSFGTFHVKLFLGSNVWVCAGCGKKSTEFWDFYIFWRKPETPKERACPPSLDRDIIQSKQNRYISSWPVYPPYSLADVNQMPFQFWEIFEDAVVVFVLDLIQKPYRCFPALKEITIVIKTLYSFQQM